MAHSLPVGPMTVEESFDFEARSSIRHKYLEGEVFAMSGVSRRHNHIAGTIYIRLRTAGRGGACGEARLRLREEEVAYGER